MGLLQSTPGGLVTARPHQRPRCSVGGSCKTGQPCPPLSAAAVIIPLLLYVQVAAPEPFSVLGPDAPVIALVGSNALLPCRLSPAHSAEGMQVKWTHSPSGREVYVLRGDRSKLPGSEYQNRTALVMDSIALGNLALRIQDIRPSDEGQYVCEFQSNAYSNRTFLELSVGGLGSTPQIHIVGLEPGGIRVRCVSVGWYPAPQLLWRNSQEEILTPDEILETRSEGGLFNISSSIVLQENNHPALSCAVTAVTHKKMSSVLISGLFPSFLLESYILPALLTLLILIIIASGSFNWKLRKEAGETRAELEWQEFLRKVSLSEADVTLDENTAHPCLLLSEDRRSVIHMALHQQDLPRKPCRFDSLSCVLGMKLMVHGHCYWDVVVTGPRGWAVGVAQDSVERTGKFRLYPDMGVCALQCRDSGLCALTIPETPLLPRELVPEMLRVHLDLETGCVGFYDATSMTHIYSFRHSFKREVVPFFLLQNSGTQVKLLP